MTETTVPDDDSVEITGADLDAWFAALEAGVFVERWDATERAIAAETAVAHAALCEAEPAAPASQYTPTHAALDASEE